MLLIISLGLFATLALVSGDCNVGKAVSNFDYNKLTGKWYIAYHKANEEEDKLDCTYVNVYSPRGGCNIISLHSYDDSIKTVVARIAILRHFHKAGFELDYLEPSIWNGRVHFGAVDYKRFYIAKICSRELRTLFIHVAYRERYPDEATLNDAKKALSDNGIAFDTLKSWNSSRCDHLNYNPDRSLEL